MSSRAEAFKQAKERRKKQKEEEAQNGQGGGGSWEELNYVALANDLDVVMRIIGNPADSRSESTDPKIFEMSMIVGDNGKKFLCNWPSRDEDSGWIMRRVLDLVLTSSWDKENNQKSYRYAKSHKEVFDQVFKNGKPENQYESGWKPSRKVFMNVIARSMMDWHVENKKTVLVSKKMSVYDEGKVFYDRGFPVTGYNAIWDDVVEYSGDWEDYDVILRRVGADPWYKAFHGVEDRRKISEEAKTLVVEGEITEEERSWEMQDIDKITQVTSYSKLKSRIKNKLSLVDAHFNTKFHEELMDLASDEEAKRKEEAGKEAEKEIETDVAPEEPKKQVVVDKKVSPKEEEFVERVAKRTARKPVEETPTLPWEGLADGSFNGTTYKGVEKMTDDEKAMVTGISDEGQFEYVQELKGEPVQLLAEEETKFMSPEQFHVCPLTGLLF